MKKVIITVFSVLCLMAAFTAAPAFAAGEEVAERLELNAATLEEIAALGVLTEEEAAKVIELRDMFGNLQSYEELSEAGLTTDKIDELRPLTTVNYMATDCNC